MRQGNRTPGSPHRHSHGIFQEQRAGYSIDDLDRYGMHVPETTRTSALWRRVRVGDLSQALRDGDVGIGEAAPADRPGQTGMRPAGPAPEDQRMMAAIRDWAALDEQHRLPLRGSFADFLEAFRVQVTGISVHASQAREPSHEDLAAVAGGSAAAAFLRGEIGLRDLQYQARHRDGLGAYRLGEAQLEDLGYYRRLPHPPTTAGPARLSQQQEPIWHGRFIGRRGIRSLPDLLRVDVQERIVLEAFARHLHDIADLLPAGTMLADLVGRPIAGSDDVAVPACEPGSRLTVSAMLAAAQLHGPAAMVDAVLHPESLTRGRAMEQCLRRFAGFATPFDGMPRPSGPDIDHLMTRVRQAAAGLSAAKGGQSSLAVNTLTSQSSF